MYFFQIFVYLPTFTKELSWVFPPPPPSFAFYFGDLPYGQTLKNRVTFPTESSPSFNPRQYLLMLIDLTFLRTLPSATRSRLKKKNSRGKGWPSSLNSIGIRLRLLQRTTLSNYWHPKGKGQPWAQGSPAGDSGSAVQGRSAGERPSHSQKAPFKAFSWSK